MKLIYMILYKLFYLFNCVIYICFLKEVLVKENNLYIKCCFMDCILDSLVNEFYILKINYKFKLLIDICSDKYCL